MNSPTAVVIEDDPDLAGLISTAFGRAGFTVHTAGSGPDGVQSVKTLDPALVTIDLNLPGFDGLEVIRRIRLFSTVPLMVISASGHPHDHELALIAGADHYLATPFTPAVLQAHARALLRRPALNTGQHQHHGPGPGNTGTVRTTED